MQPDVPCAPAPSATPTAGTSQTLSRRFLQTVLDVVDGILRFPARLINDDDQAVSMQLTAFAVLLPFSIYWLQTRPAITTAWASCFGTIWAAVALKDVFKRRNGGMQ